MTKVQKDECCKIADHYGAACQTQKAKEEMYELIDALNRDPGTSVTEEIADVYVMLCQLRHLFGITDEEITQWTEHKIRRQIGRIAEETDEL